MPEVGETQEQFMKSGVTTRFVKKFEKQRARDERRRIARGKRNAIEQAKADIDYKVRQQIKEHWRNQAHKLKEAHPDICFSTYDTASMIAKEYGADADDGKFWANNCNPFNFIPRAIRYMLLFRRTRKALGI